MPDPAGKEYNVMFETLPTIYTGADVANNKMGYNFDIADGKAAQIGTVYLEQIELYYYSIP